MADWISFWDAPHAIYVNARHRDIHYRTIADDILRLVRCSSAVVMDYGCGDALHADHVAAATGRLILVEAAPSLVETLRKRFAGDSKVEVWTPERLAQCPERSLDLILLHSVAQYLTPENLDALLARFRPLLKSDGQLIVGDVIPPRISAWTDVRALLHFAAAHRFLGAAIVGLARTLASDYPLLRKRLGLACYSTEAMTAKLSAAGFSARRMPANLGHNQARMAFLARPL